MRIWSFVQHGCCSRKPGADWVQKFASISGFPWGGLGGGSSDAASTLIALNRLWQTGIDRNRCSPRIAHGADVPVFVLGRNAFAEGLASGCSRCACQSLVCGVVSAGASAYREGFAAEGLTRDTPPIKVPLSLTRWSATICRRLCVNVFPQVKVAIDWLVCHGNAAMTRSGACVFAEFESRQQAKAC